MLSVPPAEATAPRGFSAAVFAGGGCRCFWQAGFWQEAAPAIGLAPRVIAAVSAGAAIATAIVAGRTPQALEAFKSAVAANPRNRYPGNWWRGGPVFPHERIYREAIVASSEARTLERLREGPEIRVLLGRPPGWAGVAGTYALGAVGLYAKRWLESDLHGPWGRRLGFAPEVVSMRSCRSLDEVVELILHSSCTPPALPLYHRDGRPVLDGGIVDGVPVEAVGDARSTLVLLSSHRDPRALPRRPGRTYVAPSEPVPVAMWDYTSAERVQATFDLGRRDGERFARAVWQSAPGRTGLNAA